jgi:hypothetical protein
MHSKREKKFEIFQFPDVWEFQLDGQMEIDDGKIY